MDEKGFYCGNCGEKLPVGSKFCPKCGATVLENSTERNSAKGNASFSANTQADAAAKDGTKEKGFLSYLKWLILAAVIVIVVILLIVFLVSPGSVKLNKYMTIESSGVDGYGTVTCDFDLEAFYWDYADKIEVENANALYDLVADYASPVEMLFYECVDWTVIYPSDSIQNGSLSNGDKIMVEWRCDDNAAKKYFNKKLKYSTITYTVKDLSDAKMVDVFDYIDLVSIGADPVGEVYVGTLPSADDVGITYLDFDVSQSSGLHNGDSVTVSFNEEEAEELARLYGIAPSELEKVYTVDGLDRYITSVSEIPADMLSSIQDVSEKTIRNTEESSYTSGVSISDLTYDGCYLVYEDPEGEHTSYSTSLYAVYTVTVSENVGNTNDSFTYYTYVEFEDPMVAPDGAGILDVNNASMCSASIYRSYSGSWNSSRYHGYETMAELLSALGSTNFLTDTDISGVSENGKTTGGTNDSENSESTENTEEQETGDYLCSYSSDRKINPEDLSAIKASDYGTLPAGKSLEQMIINEIYAKHGYKFTTPEIQAYFDQKPWYKAIGSYESDMDVVESHLTSIEKQNVDYLSSLL